jgi:aminocarboxymuconate-semialdehyde decarboxylase
LLKKLKKRPLEYFRLFYADTALMGARDATLLGLKFFGPDRVLFASDSPFDPEKGSAYIRWTIEIIDGLDIPSSQRQAIYEGNARRLLKLRYPV